MRRIGLASLFGKKTDKKPTAAVFVDYEHWYISITKLHGVKPNIKGWAKEISKKYEIKDISFFGDFSNPSLASEILKIRAVSNNIIQTSNIGNYKKDFTDFIMLDHIYQKAMFAHDIDTFIIFSGDGHFASVASCLKNSCNKEVVIFGVKDAFSNQLKEIASHFIEVPTALEIHEKYFDMIFTNIKDVEKTGRSARPSFAKTVEHVSALYGVGEEKISSALNVLIDLKYIKRKEILAGKNRIMVLEFDWNKIEADEIWVKDHNLKRVEVKKAIVKAPEIKKTVLKPQKKTVAVIEAEKKEEKPKQKPKRRRRRPAKKQTEGEKKPLAEVQSKAEQKEAKKPQRKRKVQNKAPQNKEAIKPTETKTAPTPAKKKKRRRYYPPKNGQKKKETVQN